MKYPLATETWTDVEKNAAKSVIDSGMCTMGKITQQFEEEFAKFFGSKYAVFSNSGSSANLLAVAALVHKYDLQRGDEVIVPAVSWSTTYYPLQQYGLKLVFVDVNESDFNINVEEIHKAVTDKTRMILAVNLLGMPCNFGAIEHICKSKNIILMEDNCESMGAKYDDRYCGTIGEVGTFSTFFSHHICTVEGGVTVTDDEELYQLMLSIRAHGWTRNLPDENHIENKTGNSFHDSFRFVLPGYNLRNNDVFAAIGLEQLKKLPTIIENRIANWNYLCWALDDSANGYLTLQNSNDHLVTSSWFGFGFIVEEGRDELIAKLIEKGIECRPIVAGNFCKNPVIKYMDYRIVGDLPVANKIDTNGFFIGNNGESFSKEIDYFINLIENN